MNTLAPVTPTAQGSHFVWEDPFLLDDQLSEEERMIRDTAAAYAQEKLQPRVIEAYANETRGWSFSRRTPP